MIRVLILFILFFAFTSNGCRNSDKEIVVGNFDISNDDKQILFSCFNNNSSSIYSMDIDGKNTKLLVKASNMKSYFNPKYSHDCSKIVFIAYVNGDLKNCALFIANSDGTNSIRLTNGGEIITEAAFSSNDSEVFFCKANVYGNHSPIGQEQAHDFDIYSINIKKRKIKKLSELKSYGLYYVSEIDSASFLMQVDAGSNGGMFLLSKNEPGKTMRIIPKNNPRGDASLYYMPIFSKFSKILAFVAPYEIYTMDLESKNARLLFDNTGHSLIEYICFYHTQQKLLFLKEGETVLHSINIDGTGLQTIPCPIDAVKTKD